MSESRQSNVTISMPPAFKEAVERAAELDMCSVSALLRRAAAPYLRSLGLLKAPEHLQN
jgi:hypothetical protein